MTNWERATKFQFSCFPIIAFAGKLWNCKDIKKFDQDKEFSSILKELINLDEISLEGIKSYYFLFFPYYHFSKNYIRAEIQPKEQEYYTTIKFLDKFLGNENIENEILQDIKLNLKEKILMFEIRKVLYEDFFSKNTSKIKNLLEELDEIKNEKLRKWEIYRKGIPTKIPNYYKSIKEEILKFMELKNKSNYFLMLYLFLPDIYGAPLLSFSVYNKNGKFKNVFENLNLKPVFPETSYYSFLFPFNFDNEISSVKIEVNGYGGQGITYFKIIDKNNNRYIPHSIKETEGVVENPLDLLIDNLRWTYLGLREIKIGFKWNEYKDIKHSIKVNLSYSH